MKKVVGVKTTKTHPQKRFEEIVTLIKREILLKNYKVGDVLPKEEELAAQLNVSRPLVREALGVLKTQGYLEARRGVGGGTFVRDILLSGQMDELISDLIIMGQMSVADVCNARLLIEPEGARCAAMCASPAEIRTLAEIVEKSRTSSHRDKAINHLVEFHNYIALCSKNIYFAITIRDMMSFTQIFIDTFVDTDHDIHNDAFHETIFDAIAANDSQRAYELMFIHVSELKDSMCTLESQFRDICNSNLRDSNK